MTPSFGTYKIVQGRIYDTLFLPENMPNNRAHLFTTPVGQYAGRKIKMHEHTNMQLGCMLPAPQKFSIRQIVCGFYQGGEYVEPFPGVLHLNTHIDAVQSFDLSAAASDQCKSLICIVPPVYPEGFLEVENTLHPIIHSLEQMECFSLVLELNKKPDIPTEFLAVLIGDHYLPVMEAKPAKA